MEPTSVHPSNRSETQIRSLVQLLSDSDPRIVKIIHARLLEIGSSALPYLIQAQTTHPELADRLTQVVDDIHFRSMESRMRQMGASPDEEIDLERGAFLIAEMAYPSLNVPSYQEQIQEMAARITRGLSNSMSIQEKIHALNHFLFTEEAFKGNAKDYYDPDNSFLNRVLDRRSGIPISLSVLYLLLGQRLGLPLRGVGMPGHFMVGLESEDCFIDCFNGGILLSQADCARLLREAGHGFELRYLNTSTPRQILQRMLGNLVGIYQARKENDRAHRFQRMIHILSGSSEPPTT